MVDQYNKILKTSVVSVLSTLKTEHTLEFCFVQQHDDCLRELSMCHRAELIPKPIMDYHIPPGVVHNKHTFKYNWFKAKIQNLAAVCCVNVPVVVCILNSTCMCPAE